jgi:hypothetical protein
MQGQKQGKLRISTSKFLGFENIEHPIQLLWIDAGGKALGKKWLNFKLRSRFSSCTLSCVAQAEALIQNLTKPPTSLGGFLAAAG